MYARVTLLEIDTLRVSIDDAVGLFREHVLPDLKHQPGYEGVYVMATPEGRGMLISLWATPEAADAHGASGFYAETLERYLTLFRSPPGRERYEVLLTDSASLTPT